VSKINFVLSRLGLARPRWVDGYAHDDLDAFINSIFSRLGLSYRYRFLALDKVYLEMCLSTAHDVLSHRREGMLATGALPDALLDVNAALRQIETWQKQCSSTIDIDLVYNTLVHQKLEAAHHSEDQLEYYPLPADWY